MKIIFFKNPDSLVGCYAPDGVHSEKPIENAIKCNVSFISIFHEKPSFEHPSSKKTVYMFFFFGITTIYLFALDLVNEIENVEILMTDQGMYVFNIYTNGHILDTSLIWIAIFKVICNSANVMVIQMFVLRVY